MIGQAYQPDIINALLNVFHWIVPEAILGIAACVLFLGGTFRANRHLWAGLALAALGGAGIALALTPFPHAGADPAARAAVFAGSLYLDPLAVYTKVIALGGGAILVLLSWGDVPDGQAAEYHACLLLIVAGLCLTGAANELVTLFLALELISIPTYILLYLPRYTKDAQEAAMKYFLLSIFSSALVLFGFSYLYGVCGTTNLPAITEALTRTQNDANLDRITELASLPAVVQVALIMIVAGLGFRITAVPFHFYAPDVYQGTTSSAAGLLAFVPKAAGFIALLRVLGYVPVGLHDDVLLGRALGPQVPTLLWILAAVSMTVGNVLGLLQDNVKRLLAYSSVAHGGYMLIGLAAAPYLAGASSGSAPAGGVDAVLFYLVAYGAMTIGAFAVLSYLSTPERPVETVDDLAGLSQSHPGIALLLVLFLFSLIGMPLTAGFAGKFLLFWGAMAVPGSPAGAPDPAWLFPVLALLGALNAAIGAWYYLRIAAVLYLRNPIKPLARRWAWPGLAALWICAIITLVGGIYPRLLLRQAQEASQVAGRDTVPADQQTEATGVDAKVFP